MQDAKVFSYDKPEKLAELMKEVEFEEMQSLVQDFIGESLAR